MEDSCKDENDPEPVTNDSQSVVLGNSLISFAIVLCTFGFWSTYSPVTIPYRSNSVRHISHLTQRGSGTFPVPLPLSNVTRLGLLESDIALVLFPRDWQTAGWSRVVFRFDRFPFDRVTGIDVYTRVKGMRTLAWVGHRLILDSKLNETIQRFENLDIPCKGSQTTLGVVFLRLPEGRWDEAVVVRASKLVPSFSLVKIEDFLWLAGRPYTEDRWQGRVRRIHDIPGNVSLFGPVVQGSMSQYT